MYVSEMSLLHKIRRKVKQGVKLGLKVGAAVGVGLLGVKAVSDAGCQGAQALSHDGVAASGGG